MKQKEVSRKAGESGFGFSFNPHRKQSIRISSGRSYRRLSKVWVCKNWGACNDPNYYKRQEQEEERKQQEKLAIARQREHERHQQELFRKAEEENLQQIFQAISSVLKSLNITQKIKYPQELKKQYKEFTLLCWAKQKQFEGKIADNEWFEKQILEDEDLDKSLTKLIKLYLSKEYLNFNENSKNLSLINSITEEIHGTIFLKKTYSLILNKYLVLDEFNRLTRIKDLIFWTLLFLTWPAAPYIFTHDSFLDFLGIRMFISSHPETVLYLMAILGVSTIFFSISFKRSILKNYKIIIKKFSRFEKNLLAFLNNAVFEKLTEKISEHNWYITSTNFKILNNKYFKKRLKEDYFNIDGKNKKNPTINKNKVKKTDKEIIDEWDESIEKKYETKNR